MTLELPGSQEPPSSTLPFVVRAPGGSLEVVLFRADDVRGRVVPSPRVLKAIEAVRSDDTSATRQVLCDVLEEVGAVAEAEYVRLELELQGHGDVAAPVFLDGVRRLRALSSVVGPTFRYLVGRDVPGCAGVRWEFRCPRPWHELVKTTQATERVCSTCRQLVVQGAGRLPTGVDEDAAARLSAEGVCVSVSRLVRGSVATPRRQPAGVGPVPPRVNLAPTRPWWKRLLGR